MKRLLTAAIPLLLLLLLLSGPTHAQITADTVSSGGSSGTNVSTTLTFTHTVGTGNNRMLVVGVAMRTDNNANTRVNSVTWNGAALTCLVARNDGGTVACGATGTATNQRSEIWTLANPASGTNLNIVVTSNAATTIAAAAQSYANVVSVASGGTNGSTTLGTTGTITGITIPAGGVEFDDISLAQSITALTASGTGHTLIADASDTVTNGNHVEGGTGQITGQTSGTAGWSWTGNSRYAETSAVLSPVVVGTISKAFAPTTIAAGGTSVLTLTFANSNAVSLVGAGVVDNLPSGVQVASTPGNTNTCGATFTNSAGDTTLTVSGGTVPANNNCSASVNVTAASAGTYNNTTNAVTSTNGGTGAVSNTATLTVTLPPTITKSFAASPIALNTSTTMTLAITNPSAAVAQTGLAVTDTFPTGLTVAATPNSTNTCGGTFTAAANATSVSLTGGSLAASGSCALTVSVTGTTAGSKTNSATVSSTNEGTGNTSSATIVVVGPPTITKAFGSASMAQNTGSTTLTLMISNPAVNTMGLTGVAVTDNLPSGMTQTGVATTCTSGSVASSTSTSIVLSGATIPASGSCTVTATVSDTTSGVASNTTGAVSSTNGGTGLTANATIAVEIPPTITKAFAAAEIAPGGTSTLTLTFTNPSANTVALTGLAVSDTLPSGVQVAATPSPTNTCGGTFTAPANATTISLSGAATVGINTSCSVSVAVTASVVGSYVNTTGNVSATNGGTGGTATATLTVAAPPTITKSFTNASIPSGGTSTLAYTITNPATNAGAMNGIAVTDTFPTGMTVASTPNLSNTCGGTISGGASGNTTLSLSGGSIATAGGTCTVSVAVTSATVGNSVNTTGTVSSTNYGTGTTATATLNVVAPPTIAKAFGAGAAGMPVNGTSTMTINITNPAPNTVAQSGVAVSDTFPSGMTISTAATTTCSGGTLTGGGVGSSTVSLSGASIPTSSSCTITASVTDTTAGTATNTTGAVSSTNGGTGLTASANLIVNNPPTVSKTFSPPGINTGATSVLTITITNPDTVSLTGVAISDTFPSGLVIASPNGGSDAGCTGATFTDTAGTGVVSITGATVAVGTPCVIKVNVTSAVGNTYNNTTSAVSSTNGGTGTTASATLTVTAISTVTAVSVGAETPGNVGPGQSATYAITTTWTGPGTCTSVPLTINWTPAAGETAAFSPTTVSNSSTSTTLTISSTGSTPAGSTSFTVTATSTGGVGTCGTGSVTSSPASAFVVATAVIQGVTVGTQNPNPVIQGSSATFAISTTWTGTGLNCVSNPLQMVWTPPSPDTTATFNPATVSSGSTSSTLTITTFSDTPPSMTSFNVEVSNSTGGGCSSSNLAASSGSTLVVSGNAPPSITKAFAPANIAPNATSTLTLTLTALAADTSTLTGVAVSDPLPSGMTVAGTPAATNTCGGTFSAAANATTISLSGGSLAAGASCAVSVSVTASTPGPYTNTTGNVTATNVGYAGGNATATMTVYGSPTQLVFGTQPSNTGQGQAITPAVTVQVEDAQNNIVTNSSASITITIGNEGTGPGNGYLNGTTTVNAVSGVATFSNLSINRQGTGYTLVASSSTLTSATSNAFNITQPTDNYTEPFTTGHGWTYTQLTCGATCSNNASVASPCDVTPCVSATISSGVFNTAQTMTGYFHNPSGYTWQTIGVPAGATVNSVVGSWWDEVTQSGAGCDTAANTTTAGMHIYNSANTTEITSAPVFADTSVLGDGTGARHTGTSVNVTAAFGPSSTAITLRFDLNPGVLGQLLSAPTCNIFGDSFNLLITYTLPNGGRRGQVIIGFMRMPDGDFQMAKPVLVSSTQDSAEDRAASANLAMLSKRTE